MAIGIMHATGTAGSCSRWPSTTRTRMHSTRRATPLSMSTLVTSADRCASTATCRSRACTKPATKCPPTSPKQRTRSSHARYLTTTSRRATYPRLQRPTTPPRVRRMFTTSPTSPCTCPAVSATSWTATSARQSSGLPSRMAPRWSRTGSSWTPTRASCSRILRMALPQETARNHRERGRPHLPKASALPVAGWVCSHGV